ncbi:MAG: NAD(P)/FAD-dependent oxidoreductase, partial [Thermodesulfobacteriota bacterium]
RMRTSAPDVWAAGDVAQAPDIFGRGQRLLPTLTDAGEQGRTAGRDMADDPQMVRYPGGMPRNTFTFFGHQAFSVGLTLEEARAADPAAEGIVSQEGGAYLVFVFHEERIVGVSGLDSDLDPGVMAELLRRGGELDGLRQDLISRGRETSRLLMSRDWR